MDQILNTLLPVFLVIALGFLLGKSGFLSEVVLTELNRLLFWVCLPALIIEKLSSASEIPPGTGSILLVFILATLAVIVLAFVAARILRLERSQAGTFVQATFRGNLGYTGIPLVLFALQGAAPEIEASTMAQTLFVFAPAMVFYNVAAVVLLSGDRGMSLGSNLRSMVKKIAKNPLIAASFVGVILFLLPIELPGFALNTFSLTGQMAAPAALLCVGGSMAYVSMQGRYRSATVASILKVTAVPCLAALIAIPFNLSDTSRIVLLILSACPTAVASYVMAKQMNGDEALASGAIVISTVLSMPVLAVILGMT